MFIRKVPEPLHTLGPVRFQVPVMLPLEPLVPVSASVMLASDDVVETFIKKLPVCTPLAVPERANVAVASGVEAKHGTEPLKLNAAH